MAIHSDIEVFLKACPPMVGARTLADYFKAQGASYVGLMRSFSVTVAHTDLATAGTKTLFAPAADETWRLHTLFLLGPFTNFSAGGDRLCDVKSDTNIYSRIPNATLESLAAAAWGATGLPFPGTAAHGTALITYAAPLLAAYQGGSTDHNAGSMVLQGLVERVA
ncbi:MAG: hypothetical protein AB7O45_02745 [Alphaproteobacteria bacterium]